GGSLPTGPQIPSELYARFPGPAEFILLRKEILIGTSIYIPADEANLREPFPLHRINFSFTCSYPFRERLQTRPLFERTLGQFLHFKRKYFWIVGGNRLGLCTCGQTDQTIQFEPCHLYLASAFHLVQQHFRATGFGIQQICS